MKKFVKIFAVLVVTFILSAVLLGQYHSAPSVILGFAAAMGYNELNKRNIL